jgi:hypothetical protein
VSYSSFAPCMILKLSIEDDCVLDTTSFLNLYVLCSENVGLLALTRVGSRRVVQISAGFMIFFSVLGM